MTDADDRPGRLATSIARIQAPASWFARTATVAAALAVPPALIVWWAATGDDLGDRWRGTVSSVVTLVVLLLPTAWLVNVRLALTSLLELPDKLQDVARRRGGDVRNLKVERPKGGVVGAVKAVRSVVGDYQDVVGGWAVVAQLLAPWFWGFTVLALLAVPLLWLAALVALVVELL